MFTEKLRSLLKFGTFSTRYKDVYDMYYQCEKMDETKLIQCMQTFIFDDPGMRENELKDIIKRLKSVFGDRTYKQRVDKSDKRWMDDRIEDIFARIVNYLEGIL